MDESSSKQPLVRRLRDFLFRPSSLSLIVVVAIGMVSGLIFWGGFNTGMEATNSLEFCVSCHEMRDTVFQEYKETIHYKNRSGVRAICSDCHVPKDWTHKFVRKVQASQELYVKFVTGGSTRRRSSRRSAWNWRSSVWEAMKGSDSRECRNCHSWDAMDPKKQRARGHKKMEEGLKAGKTCIDCHKGVAHLLPKEFKEDEEE